MGLVVIKKGCHSRRQCGPCTRKTAGTMTFQWMPEWKTGHTPGLNIKVHVRDTACANSRNQISSLMLLLHPRTNFRKEGRENSELIDCFVLPSGKTEVKNRE